MKYKIKKYTFDKARELGVVVKPSKDPSKKIDVFINNSKLCSIGAAGYGDYPTYLLEHGKAYADERRRLYKIRHIKDIGIVGSPGYYANLLLW